MKIGNNNIINLENYIQNLNETNLSSQTNKPETSVKNVQETHKDEILFSSGANQNQAIQNMLKNVSETRESKIAELKSKIENQTYNIKGEEVGEKMLSESMLINKLL